MNHSNLSQDAQITPVADAEGPNFTIQVPTSQPIQEVEMMARKDKINIASLATNADLAMLKKQDPFLYYSIPCIWNAEMQLKTLDISCLKKCLDGRRRSVSCPSRLETQTTDESEIVSRKSCLSFECHIDTVLSEFYSTNEDQMNDLFDIGVDSDIGMFLDRSDYSEQK
mmetsp:Transcript_2276/g.4188  ORF Transcript_2276/g.4188 Transcript_2276/m.4188 type:complete len:169 (+) Transcript_2276:69-575(+)